MAEMSRGEISEPKEKSIYTLIANIPLTFHTPDLRNFFSYSIEKEFFICFNYRHRPHHSGKFNTCICKIKPNKFDEFTKLYDKKNWINSSGKLENLKCSIVKIKVIPASSNEENNAANKQQTNESSSLNETEINNLLELTRIPSWMPQGNVGTPTKHFVQYINQCIMPQSLISKLGINLKTFKKHNKRVYSNMEYDYGEIPKTSSDEVDDNEQSEDDCENLVSHVDVVSTANGHRIVENLDDHKEIRERNYLNEKKMRSVDSKDDVEKEDQEGDDDDGNELEDWERHESLHEDVTKQDRTSPYFFENEIELKWEKGGSGLVFYTDDNFWKEQENKDFDAETADDLDVDMSVYYDANGGDKDSRDMLEMRRMELLWNGASSNLFDDDSSRFKSSFKKLNAFHASTSASASAAAASNPPEFGRKHLEKLGWRDGEPVGMPNRLGLKEPLDASDGKHPLDKTGLGYHGEKVDKEAMIELQKRNRVKERRNMPYYIGSKYDGDQSRPDTLLRRFDPTMKYRENANNNNNNNNTKK